MTAVVIGVDAGGTHTRVMVADESGASLATAEGVAGAVRPGHAEASADVIAETVRSALALLSESSPEPKLLCVGAAGVGRDDERAALWQALSAREIADDVLVHTDAMIALDDAFGEGPGILVMAGTGSIAYGRGPTGAFARCGGWGPVCGDEGSGAWLGRRALSVVTAAHDGREPETALTPAILDALELSDVGELIPWAASASPATLATLAPVVLAAAQHGDLRANSLVTMAAEELVLHARTLARQLFVDERAAAALALGGGLLGKQSVLRKRFLGRLKTAVPGAVVREDDVVPVRGAVRAALRFLSTARV